MPLKLWFIYLTTGNGTVGLNDGSNPNDTTNRGESLIKLTTASGALKIADFFTPSNWKYLEAHDLDFGSDGVLLIPDTHLSLSGSKESYLYLIDNTNMGHTTTDNSNVLQLLNINARNTVYQDHLHGTPVYYKNENGQEYIYAWAENAFLKQFPFNRSTMRFDTNRVTLGTTILGEGMPGAMLAVSSNSAQKGTGLLWASHPKSGNSINDIVPGMLQVFDANDVSKELWNSNINMARDSIGRFAKFVCPTIANGKVYMSTFSNKLAVYGLILNSYAPCGLPPAAPWRAANVGTNMIKGSVCENNGTFTLYSSGQNINDDSDQLFFIFQPFDSLSSGEIKARVLSISNTHVGAKCGVMFRSNLYPGAPNVFISKTNLDSAVLEYRTHTDSSSFIIAKTIIKAPSWVKLVKTGSIYTSYTSQDGIVWDTIDSLNIKMGKYLYAGIAFNTQNDTVTEVATVDSVTVLDYSIPTLEIRNLTANYINETKAQLHWISANEHPDNIFYVERSNDSSYYYVIDSVVATPGYQTHQYTYIDNTPSGGKNYYRIKQKLSTGASKNSNIASLNFIPYRLDVYPNPANRQIFIRYYDDFEIGSTVTIQLISSFGNLIYNSKIKIPIVSQTIVLDLPLNTKRGLYFLRIMNPKGKILTRKIIVGQ